MNRLLTTLALPLLLLAPSCGGGSSSPAGTWVLDPSAMDSLVKEAKDSMSEEDKKNPMAMMVVQMMEAFKAAKMEMAMAADGTWTGTMEMNMMGQTRKSTSKGTWKLEGEKLTVVTTDQDGKKADKPEEKTATFKNDEIRISEDQGGKSFSIVLKRKG